MRALAAGAFRLLVSLELTVACLALATVLVFVGTIAQVDMGLYGALRHYFQSFFVMWTPPTVDSFLAIIDSLVRRTTPPQPEPADFSLPVFPGGYLIGTVLLANLVASHFYRFRFSISKLGIWLTHFGLIVMLAGGLLTDLFSVESFLSLDLNQSKNYTESHRQAELALTDVSNPDATASTDTAYVIPQSRLQRGAMISDPRLPVRVRVLESYTNVGLTMREAGMPSPPGVPRLDGIGERVSWIAIPESNRIERPNRAAAVIELLPPAAAGQHADAPAPRLGAWFVADGLLSQDVKIGDKTFKLSMRARRYYKPYSMTLTKFTYDRYPGTDIPKNFASTVRIVNPEHHAEDRSVLIYMNNPLRYMGETFYQNSVSNQETTSILQVVRNPNWLLPYISCAMMTVGMLLQFGTHLSRFLAGRGGRGATTADAGPATTSATSATFSTAKPSTQASSLVAR
ncbi:ResB protein required for cytochrome C biosynthesis [Verrucomicrobia bacterium LW23]|nr:ResB protein required for cytochrome C biosynthesis [Verrucomicrobia bacterium LW23]